MAIARMFSVEGFLILSAKPGPAAELIPSTQIGLYRRSLTWTPRVCSMMAFWAIIKGFGTSLYLHAFAVQVTITNYQRRAYTLSVVRHAEKLNSNDLVPSYVRGRFFRLLEIIGVALGKLPPSMARRRRGLGSATPSTWNVGRIITLRTCAELQSILSGARMIPEEV